MSDWWKGAVIYQVYPRSFLDSTGNGVGDLAGVTAKLGYIASLGVDGIWLSPFFTSPMHDFGYDVADYLDVDPVFGSLADFDRLLAEAHNRGLKVIIDQIYSHTSDRHAWFRQSRHSRKGPRHDWYVWADARPDGAPPNNWLSYFGGPAWSWDTQRRQYYLHNFLAQQPDLNFHNPDVQDAILDVARFWLDRGVDGFRLDAANYYFHDAALRDNPPAGTLGHLRPYHFQRHMQNRSRPETLAFLARLRQVVDGYNNRMTVAEIASDSPIARSIEYTEGRERLHTAYNFVFLESRDLSPALIRNALADWQSKDAWPSWSFSNHDFKRALTRFGGRDAGPDLAKMLIALLTSLRGTAFLYQGEELGLPQADVPFERLQDPEAIRFWPDNLGRDGCRTPMPWQARVAHAGFSGAPETWLPVDPRHEALAVDVQENDPGSTLCFARAFMKFRKAHPALRRGDIRFRDAPAPLLVFERRSGEEAVLCCFNLSGEPLRYALEDPVAGTVLEGSGLAGGLTDGTLELPGWGGCYIDPGAMHNGG